MADLLELIKKNIIQGRRNQADEGLEEELTGRPGVAELVKEALAAGIPPEQILVRAVSEGMQAVGEKYSCGQYFIPDMLAAAEATGVAVDLLAPYLTKGEKNQMKGKFILATVEKDQHDIGKNIVGIMLKGAGFRVIDLGTNVPAAQVVDAAEHEQAEFIGLSALLDTTMGYMSGTIQELQKRNLREKVKVLIGGAPTSREFAREIGADAYCPDAFAAVETANRYAREKGR